mmetsp:Transcript_20942/g.52256  ORF Transcript_20942/g.52256 Transcript_20942/m.52256 type:complete len:213 (-) Transcript_20942:276-914(-)|eukprot:CAMPEP_0182817578 /NCGR_PEP_ID=MMETSP0006_2-20121128/11545_1 /TAXON_ID=97485 /ORGANISM="Prymnesium parvum, Strain Texoma1" /LENGTH=212 /DNA_ID=CAMNT_0024943945 /DNA_START=86 /DNA_END=724 /DNA_ORIENTATION=-
MAPPPVPAPGLLSPATIDFTLSECPLLLQADEPLVTATPFLQWQAYPPAAPNSPPRVGIPHTRAVKTFLRRCTLNQTQVHSGGFSAVDCFTFFLHPTGWNRVIDQLLQSNLLHGAPFAGWPEFLTHLERISLQQADQLQLNPTDLDLGESFDAPPVPGQPGVAAGGARRGSHGALCSAELQMRMESTCKEDQGECLARAGTVHGPWLKCIHE